MAGRRPRKKKYGVGINDCEEDGCNAQNPHYTRWCGMLMRCYSDKYQKKRPTYVGCTVCEEWLTYSNFKKWMETQDWEDKQLDKDLKDPGNTVYCPEKCIFISSQVNTIFNDCRAAKGDWPIGASFDKSRNKFAARCCDGNGNKVFLGRFDTPEEAHSAWFAFKTLITEGMAKKYPDLRDILLTNLENMKYVS